jgi:osmotically-inducible protein OsmY
LRAAAAATAAIAGVMRGGSGHPSERATVARYDRGYGRDFRGRPPRSLSRYDRSFHTGWLAGPKGPAPVPYESFGRGEFGEDYSGFGGYPGGRYEGIHYGGQEGHGPHAPPPRGYDAGWARGPFVPDEAYRRHLEMMQQGHHGQPGSERPAYAGYETKTDEDLARAVCESIAEDAYLDPERIQVTASNGVVTLTGEVDDFMEARYAWDDAWETDGVRGVISHLTVNPSPEPAADEDDGDEIGDG